MACRHRHFPNPNKESPVYATSFLFVVAVIGQGPRQAEITLPPAGPGYVPFAQVDDVADYLRAAAGSLDKKEYLEAIVFANNALKIAPTSDGFGYRGIAKIGWAVTNPIDHERKMRVCRSGLTDLKVASQRNVKWSMKYETFKLAYEAEEKQHAAATRMTSTAETAGPR